MWLIGVALNLAGSLSINLSTNLIKLAHNKNYATAPEHGPSPSLLRSPRRWWRHPGGNRLWLFAIIVFALANLVNFASFAFAAQSLLSALGSVQFLSNVAFSRLVNKEPLTKWVYIGTAVIVVGCVLLVAFGNHESPTFTSAELMELYDNPGTIAYLCCGAAAVAVSYGVYSYGKRKVGGLRGQAIVGPWARWLPILYALFSGIPGTLSVLYGKSMSLLLRTTLGGNNQMDKWYTYIAAALFILTAAFWMTRFNKALKLFPVSTMMPILQVAWLLFSMVSGSLYFKETEVMGTLQIIMFAVGTSVLLAGLGLMTTSSKPKDATNGDLNEVSVVNGDSPISSKQQDELKLGNIDEESGKESFSVDENCVAVGRKGTHQPENAVSRRHTYAMAAHGGLSSPTGAPTIVVRAPSRRESREESTATKVQRAVTAPLSGVIW